MTTDFKDRAETVAQGASLIARAAPEAMKSFGALGAAANAAGALYMDGGPAAVYGADALRADDQMAGAAGG